MLMYIVIYSLRSEKSGFYKQGNVLQYVLINGEIESRSNMIVKEILRYINLHRLN